jgi:prepilin-type N-terminal cleavage/methylation domain-containing protein
MIARKILRKKRNNKGMSLVEVIISVTILSIVIVPTLNILTSAMVYNAKAKKRQQATITAESIMETFKGYDIATLEKAFSTDDASSLFGVECSAKLEGSSSESESGTSEADTTEGDVSTAKTTEKYKSYKFTIDNYQDNGRTYKAIINVIPISNANANLYVQYNTNNTNSAIYEGNKSDGKDIESKCREAFIDSEFSGLLDKLETTTPKDINGNDIDAKNNTLYDSNIKVVGRELEFEISGSDSVTITPVIKYTYYIENFVYYIPTVPENPTDPYPKDEESDSTLPTPGGVLYASEEKTLSQYPTDDMEYKYLTLEVTGKAIKTGISAKKFRRLYIYYYPYYKSGTTDKINIINSTANGDIECYLVKQRDKSISMTKCINLESAYNPSIKIDGSVTVYHNLNINLGNNNTEVKITNGANEYNMSALKDSDLETYAGLNQNMFIDGTLLYEVKLTLIDTDTDLQVAKLDSVMYDKLQLTDSSVADEE